MTHDQLQRLGDRVTIRRYTWRMDMDSDHEGGPAVLSCRLVAEYQERGCRATCVAEIETFKLERRTPAALRRFADRCERAIAKWGAVPE